MGTGIPRVYKTFGGIIKMLIICPLLIVRTDTFSPDGAYVCKLLAQSQGQQIVLPLIPPQNLIISELIRGHAPLVETQDSWTC